MQLLCTGQGADPGFPVRGDANIGGSKGGARDARPPPGVQIPSFSCSFGKNVKNNSNFGSWRPPLGKILDPPLANPPGRGRQHTILPNFPKNRMKLRKYWAPPLDPPLLTEVKCKHSCGKKLNFSQTKER